MGITVNKIRVSHVYTAVQSGLLNSSSSMPSMVTPFEYDIAFRHASEPSAQLAGTEPWPSVAEGSPYSLPWDAASLPLDVNNYWKHSLRRADYHTSTSAQAWRVQAALRPRRRLRVETNDPRVRATVDAYCHPLASTVVINLNCEGDGTLAEWAERSAAMSENVRLRFIGEPGEPKSIKRLAGGLLDVLTSARLGGTPGGSGYAPDPATITTVVQGDGSMVDCAAVEGGEVHRFLMCLAERSAFDAVAAPTGLDVHSLLSRAERAGGVLLFCDRSAVVWAPNRFRAVGRSRRLTCYHNNLVLSAAHVDAWIGTVQWGAAMLREGSAIVRGVELIERTSRLLSFLYGRTNRSRVLYRTRIAAAQIARSGIETDLTETLQYIGDREPVVPAPLVKAQR